MGPQTTQITQTKREQTVFCRLTIDYCLLLILTVTNAFAAPYIHSGSNFLGFFERGLVMLQLSSNNRILLFLLAPFLLAAPVFAQNQRATQATEATTLGQPAAIVSNGSATNHDRNQKKQLAALTNKLVTEKTKLWANELRPVSTTNENDANQEKTAAPAPPTPEEQEKLRKAAQNPIASLISVPIQENMNFGIGPHHRIQNVINIQPVIPVRLNENWNLVMRIITPIIYQPDPSSTTQGAFGFGDLNPTFFFAPAKPGKLIWGVGPAIVLPTAASRTLGQGKFSLGPGFVGLVQQKKWTVGILINNVWSVAGKQNRADVNQMLFQYFINYNLKKGYYLTWQPTLTANWKATGNQSNQRWVIPFGGGIGRIMKLGNQPVNVGIQAYANAVRPPGSAPFSLRLQIAFLYPKKPKK